MVDMKRYTAAAVGALMLAAAPMAANALSVTIDDMSTVGVDKTISGATPIFFNGTVGGFDINANSTINTGFGSNTLNTTSIKTKGVGTLVITSWEDGLSDFGVSNVGLLGTASVSDIADSATVKHFIDTGSGYTQVGSDLFFTSIGFAQTNGVVPATGTFSLKTEITLVSSSSGQTSNVNGTVTAPVPLPAAGLMLLAALGGLGGAAGLRRRRKAA